MRHIDIGESKGRALALAAKGFSERKPIRGIKVNREMSDDEPERTTFFISSREK